VSFKNPYLNFTKLKKGFGSTGSACATNLKFVNSFKFAYITSLNFTRFAVAGDSEPSFWGVRFYFFEKRQNLNKI
jgi:hypothetical protein